MEFVGLRNFRRLLFARRRRCRVRSVQPQLRFVHDEHNGVTDVNVPLDSEDPTGTRMSERTKAQESVVVGTRLRLLKMQG